VSGSTWMRGYEATTAYSTVRCSETHNETTPRARLPSTIDHRPSTIDHYMTFMIYRFGVSGSSISHSDPLHPPRSSVLHSGARRPAHVQCCANYAGAVSPSETRSCSGLFHAVRAVVGTAGRRSTWDCLETHDQKFHRWPNV
jgi:hypothetical protein